MRASTLCLGCGGEAVVLGSPDDYVIICYHCDPQGPVVRREASDNGS